MLYGDTRILIYKTELQQVTSSYSRKNGFRDDSMGHTSMSRAQGHRIVRSWDLETARYEYSTDCRKICKATVPEALIVRGRDGVRLIPQSI